MSDNSTATPLFTLKESSYDESKYNRFHCFYQNNTVFSQWHPSRFTVDNVTFTCAEQMMMYEKAKLFGDTSTMKQILQTSDPKKHKALGRKVSPFDHELWDKHREDIVYRTNKAKYTQNPELLAELLSEKYRNKEFVEASPRDNIWGIGWSEQDVDECKDRSKWKGLNLLGKILTCLRDELLESSQ